MRFVAVLILGCGAIYAETMCGTGGPFIYSDCKVLENDGFAGGRPCPEAVPACVEGVQMWFAAVSPGGSVQKSSVGPIIVEQTVDYTVTADFNVPGFLVTGFRISGNSVSDGIFTTGAAILESPCEASYSAGDGFNYQDCRLSQPVNSGTVAVRIYVHISSCDECYSFEVAEIGAISLGMSFIPDPSVPEPPTGLMFVIPSLMAIAYRFRRSNP